MSASPQKESVASTAELINNKCALKLLGIDYGDVTDEAILEFISNYVEPSSIKALLYDFFNCFYVVHLNDIDSTCRLIGKTLQMGTLHINFLPLVDCFVIANVYLSLSNKQIREIFSVFGNVCEVENHHVLPNSSKFFHVLSGTREISFFLPGLDREVEIPVTVVHSPYTFHVKHKCLFCMKHGHSLLNCPIKVEDETPSESAKNDSSPMENDEKDVVINIVQVQEMTFEVSDEEVADEEKTTENVVSDVTIMKKKEWEDNEGLTEKHKNSQGVEEGKGMIKSREETLCIKNKLKGNLPATKKKNPSSDNLELDFEHTSNLPKINYLEIPSTVQSCIRKSEGVIPTNALVELLYIDARNRGNVLSFVLQITSDVKAALTQLRKLQSDLVQDVEVLNTVECKFSKKVWSVIRALKRYVRS